VIKLILKQKDVLKHVLSIPLDERVDTGIKPVPVIQEVYARFLEGLEMVSLQKPEKDDEPQFYSNLNKLPKGEETIKKDFNKYVMIAGGCLSDHFIAKKLNKEYTFKDIDVFISSENYRSLGFFPSHLGNDEKITKLIVFLNSIFPDADKIENKFSDVNKMYTFISNRFIFGIDWKDLHIEVIVDDNKDAHFTDVEDFDISFRKFYYRGDNIITFKSSLDAIEKCETNLLNLSSPKNTFLRVAKFKSRYGFEMDSFSKIILYLTLENIFRLDPIYSEPGDPNENPVSYEEYTLLSLKIYTQNYKSENIEVYRELLQECKKEYLRLSKTQQKFLLRNYSEIKNYLENGIYRDRLICLVENVISINCIDITLEAFDNEDIFKNRKIFIPVEKETIYESLNKLKRKKKFEKIYSSNNISLINPYTNNKMSQIGANHYLFEKEFSELQKYVPYFQKEFEPIYQVDITNRLISENLQEIYPLSRKQNLKINFNYFVLPRLIRGYSFTELKLSFSEFIPMNKTKNFTLLIKWDEGIKQFKILSYDDFLFLDSERLKLISDCFEKELGYPATWI
jgi:hypothetical protein